jgi:hypothetical protein
MGTGDGGRGIEAGFSASIVSVYDQPSIHETRETASRDVVLVDEKQGRERRRRKSRSETEREIQ